MFSKILIANRGEIAVRIIRACREMGISTVAVYSQADKNALHVNMADESYCIGGPQVADSYLNMAAILEVAVVSGAQAIHPGYGLLSENAKFVSLCEKCNIEFIGPSSAMIERLGDKDEARKTMKAAGVPVTPGSDVIDDLDEAREKAKEIVGRAYNQYPAGIYYPDAPAPKEPSAFSVRQGRGTERIRRRRRVYGTLPHARQAY